MEHETATSEAENMLQSPIPNPKKVKQRVLIPILVVVAVVVLGFVASKFLNNGLSPENAAERLITVSDFNFDVKKSEVAKSEYDPAYMFSEDCSDQSTINQIANQGSSVAKTQFVNADDDNQNSFTFTISILRMPSDSDAKDLVSATSRAAKSENCEVFDYDIDLSSSYLITGTFDDVSSVESALGIGLDDSVFFSRRSSTVFEGSYLDLSIVMNGEVVAFSSGDIFVFIEYFAFEDDAYEEISVSDLRSVAQKAIRKLQGE